MKITVMIYLFTIRIQTADEVDGYQREPMPGRMIQEEAPR